MHSSTKSYFWFWLAAWILFIGSNAVTTNYLPDQVATHFNGAGIANGWMSKSKHLLGLSIMATVVTVAMIAMGYAVRRLPPALLNVPNASHWRSPENYPIACDFLLRQMFLLSAGLLLWLAAVNWTIVAANQTTPPHLEHQAILLVMLIFFVSLIGWIASLIRFFLKTKS